MVVVKHENDRAIKGGNSIKQSRKSCRQAASKKALFRTRLQAASGKADIRKSGNYVGLELSRLPVTFIEAQPGYCCSQLRLAATPLGNCR